MSAWRWPALAVCVAVTGFTAGCAPVDYWKVFDVKWSKEYGDNDRPSLDDTDIYEPVSVNRPPIELPAANGTVELSVEQAALMALANNRDLTVEELNPVITGTFEQIERGVYDPELFAEAAYSEDEESQTTDVTGEQFNTQSDSDNAAIGLRQRLPTGTDVEATLSEDRSASNRRPEQYEVRAGLSVTQSLLEGFGPAVNLASVRQAELESLASVYELRGFTEALLAETEITYWNYTLAAQQIAIFEQSLEVARRQSDDIQQQIEVGLLAETEGAAARAEVAVREQALINARSDLEAQRLLLVRLINPRPNGSLDVSIVAQSDPRMEPEPITDMPDRLALADRMRPDLNEALLRLEQNRLETIVTRNGLLPRLDLFMVLGKTGYGDSLSNAADEIDGETYDFTAGVSFSYYLNNRAAKARDLAARAGRRQAADAVANLRQLVNLDVRLAVNEVERARQQISASRATRVLQEETVRAERERFEVGASTTLLVAQAQRDLLVSQIAEVEAIVDYRVALVNLYLAEGSLLERRGIRLAVTDADQLDR